MSGNSVVQIMAGQVWASKDPRDFGRIIKITEVHCGHIVGKSSFNGSPPRKVRINIVRLTSNKRGGHGYKLVAEPASAAAAPTAPPAGEASVG